MLQDHSWRFKYTPDDGDLVKLLYIPVLQDAERYDRLTGYFSATALTLAARGIEGLVRNQGHMRLVVGCTLEAAEVEAIQRGEALRTRVERNLTGIDLTPPDSTAADALELLAWMVAQGILQVKIAVPCNGQRQPLTDSSIFHEKTGIIQDRVGDRLAWSGSLNETGPGWQKNWESINVFTSWGAEPERVEGEEANFARIWAGQTQRIIVLDVPEAVRRKLLQFAPETGLPARLDGDQPAILPPDTNGGTDDGRKHPTVSPATLRARVWTFIRKAPALAGGGEQIGEATAPVEPWPHQARAFQRLYDHWPPRLLIADEVGLGKTVQAGLLLRQAWLAERAKRILILAPKAVLHQWQTELREKFNLNWPIYDGGKLTWYPSPVMRGRHPQPVDREQWHQEPAVIVSSQLMRRRERAAELLQTARPWDLVILDEAHHARRKAAGSAREGGPNGLLKLMRSLKERTAGLVLLTATPMQVHPVEVWDLLDLLGLPPQWHEKAFLTFFENAKQPNPSASAMEQMAALFRAAEQAYGPIGTEEAQRLSGLRPLQTQWTLDALRDSSSIPRRQLENDQRRGAVAIMQSSTPVRRLISRNTREVLRRYFQEGKLSIPIAQRRVEDRFVEMSPPERTIYGAVEDYISSTYNKASADQRSAVGFVMTVYRRRLASSFTALRTTLHKRSEALSASPKAPEALAMSLGSEATGCWEDDLPDDETTDDMPDSGDMEELARQALEAEEQSEIGHLIRQIRQLPPDSKLQILTGVLAGLREEGYRQAMVFSQYTDTMDFLRDALLPDADWKLICFSGRGGEVANSAGHWQPIGRHDARQRFRDGKANLLLCTDAAAEGLNFQFCGAMVNYDMPWNPMRVEQRIGRIDRLGQQHRTIRIVNLHYEGTVETDIYRALRTRINLFESVVGRLQPILARLPRSIAENVLTTREPTARTGAEVVAAIEQETGDAGGTGFDIDAMAEGGLATPERPQAIMTMEDLDRIIARSSLMAPGIEIQPLGRREYGLLGPGMDKSVRITTDPAFFEENAESMELWSPGNPLFVAPEFADNAELDPSQKTLKDILDDG